MVIARLCGAAAICAGKGGTKGLGAQRGAAQSVRPQAGGGRGRGGILHGRNSRDSMSGNACKVRAKWEGRGVMDVGVGSRCYHVERCALYMGTKGPRGLLGRSSALPCRQSRPVSTEALGACRLAPQQQRGSVLLLLGRRLQFGGQQQRGTRCCFWSVAASLAPASRRQAMRRAHASTLVAPPRGRSLRCHSRPPLPPGTWPGMCAAAPRTR